MLWKSKRVSNFCYSIKVNKYRDKKEANILIIYKMSYYDIFIATKKLNNPKSENMSSEI